MPTNTIAATIAYRSAVALAVAGAAPQPTAAYVAFGSGDRPYSPDTDEALQAEFHRVLAEASASGPALTVRGTLAGSAAGSHVLREVGVFASDGTLMGRRVVAPKEFEPETEFEVDLVFEY